jgi:hypothetical protein
MVLMEYIRVSTMHKCMHAIATKGPKSIPYGTQCIIKQCTVHHESNGAISQHTRQLKK